MKKITNNQSGFSAIELVLIIVVVGLLAGLGYMFYKSQNKKVAAPAASASQKTTTEATKPAPDPTTNWTAYSDKTGKFSLRYPTTWVTAAHPELCSPGILLLGPTAQTVGRCASEGFGQVYIVSSNGDSRKDNELGSGYANVEKSDVTVSGITGKKESGVAKGQADPNAPAMGALQDGTVVVKYVFFTNGRTYVASYTQTKSDPDVLSDFNLLVTKTLSFN